jgi:hypothetical protein
MSSLARCVHRSFRRVEACAEWSIGAAGPVFVALCAALVALGAWTFFVGVLPGVAPLPHALTRLLRTRSSLHILLGLPGVVLAEPLALLRCLGASTACAYIITSIAVHYLHAIREVPGSVLTGLSEARHERRLGPGSDAWWLRKRRDAARASAAFSPAASASAAQPLLHAEQHRLDDAIEGDDLWPTSKMCMKCPPVMLWQALAALPPQLRAIELDVRRTLRSASSAPSSLAASSPASSARLQQQQQQHDLPEQVRGDTADEIREALGEEAYKLVPPPKPERAHHCRTCGTCALKYVSCADLEQAEKLGGGGGGA